MNTKKTRNYSNHTSAFVAALGKKIRDARKARKLTEREIAERVGISRTTLQKIEKGDLKCEIGMAIETAVLLGVQVFEQEEETAGTA
jgi:DNA-binding XRE family transcriptional regulator